MKPSSRCTGWVGMALLVTIVAVLAGCQTQPPANAGPALSNAQRLKDNGQFEEALTAVRSYLSQHPDASDQSEALLLAGDCEFEMKKYEDAQRDYQDAQMKPKNSQISARAKFGMAQSAFAGDHYSDAIKAYEAALRVDKGAIPESKAVFKLGLANIRNSNWSEGRKKMQQVVEQFKGSPEAELAAEVLALNRDFFQLQCGAFETPQAMDKQMRLLRSKGLVATTIPITRKGQRLQAVMGGNYTSFAEAKDAGEKLSSQGVACIVFP